MNNFRKSLQSCSFTCNINEHKCCKSDNLVLFKLFLTLIYFTKCEWPILHVYDSRKTVYDILCVCASVSFLTDRTTLQVTAQNAVCQRIWGWQEPDIYLCYWWEVVRGGGVRGGGDGEFYIVCIQLFDNFDISFHGFRHTDEVFDKDRNFSIYII